MSSSNQWCQRCKGWTNHTTAHCPDDVAAPIGATFIMKTKTQQAEQKIASELFKETRAHIKSIQRLRKLNLSNHEIAIALGIPKDSPLLEQ